MKITDWYGQAVAWATSEGIVNGKGAIEGVGNNCFCPSDVITREQACTILIRYAKEYAGKNIPLTYESIGFKDAANVSSWAQEAVSYCEQLGFLSGYLLDNNNFYPQDAATRADVATIISRYVARYGK